MTKAEAYRRQRQWLRLQVALLIPFIGFGALLVAAAASDASPVVVWLLAAPFAVSGVLIIFAYGPISALVRVGDRAGHPGPDRCEG